MTEWSDPFEQSELLLEAINEVRSDKDVSEYNFLDKIEKVHPSPSKKGNAGLSNAYAELAIYEEDGELVVDEELVRELDSRLAEREGVSKRHRFESIIMDSDKRPGEKNSLLENQVNGHERLKNRIREFYEATGREEEFEKYADGGLLTQGDISSKPESEIDQGGETQMTDEIFDHQLETLAGALSASGDYSKSVVHAAAVKERRYDDTIEAAKAFIEEYRGTGINVQRGVQSWIDGDLRPNLEGTEAALQSMEQSLDEFEQNYLDGSLGISDDAKDAFSAATGYEIDQDL